MRKNLIMPLCIVILCCNLSCKPAMSTTTESDSNLTEYRTDSETDMLKLLKLKQKEILMGFSFSDDVDEGSNLDINSDYIKLSSDDGTSTIIKWSKIKQVKVVSSGAINQGVAVVTFTNGEYKFIVLPLSLGLRYSDSTEDIVKAIKSLAKIKGARFKEFEMAPTSSGVDGIHFVLSEGKWGAIDDEGYFVTLPIYDHLQVFGSDGTSKAQLNGKFGRIDTKGEIVVKVIYDLTNPFIEDFSKVRKNGKYGFIGRSGLEIPIIYDEVFGPSGGVMKVIQNGKVAYLNKWGRELTNREDWGIWKND